MYDNLDKDIERGRNDFPYFCEHLLGIILHQGQLRAWKKMKERYVTTTLILAGNRSGKGIALDERVVTSSGYKKASEIVVGETLFSDTGKKTKVIGVFPQGEKETYRFIFDDNSSLIVDDSHLWNVKDSKRRFWKGCKNYGEWETVGTKEIVDYYRKYDFTPPAKQRYSIPMTEPVEFDEKPVTIDPYTMGYLLGNGGLRYGTRVSFSDEEIASYLPYRLKSCKEGTCDYYVYDINEKIKELGLRGKYSHEKHIPEEYLINSIDVRLAVLRGLMDSDGSISSDNMTIEYSTSSKKLMEGIVFLVESLGGCAKVTTRIPNYTYRGEKKTGRLSYRVWITRLTVCPFRLPRKANLFRERIIAKQRILLKIEPLGQKETVCFKVDAPSELFLADHFIVTHNTIFLTCKHIWKLFYKIPGPGKKIREKDWEHIEYRTVNLAPHSNQTQIIYRHIMRIIRGQFSIQMPDGEMVKNKSKISWFIDFDGNNNPDEPPKTGKYELHFANGSSFYAFTLGGSHGDNVVGEAYAYASYDEVGRSKAIDKEHEDITTRLADWVGELDMITTPDDTNADTSDWLASIVDKAEDPNSGYRFINWTTNDNTYMSGQSLTTLLLGKTAEQQRRILKGEIVKNSTKYFPYVKIESMFNDVRYGMKRINFNYQFPQPNRLYYGGLDTSGMGKDAWSFYVIDYTTKPFKIVFDYTSAKNTPTENMSLTRNYVEQFIQVAGSNFKWKIDFTSEGGTIVWDLMKDLNPEPFKFGIEKGSGRNMKVELMETLRKCVNEECIVSDLDNDLKGQLISYRGPKDDKNRVTDRIMALGMAIYEPFNNLTKPNEPWIVDFD